MVLKYMSQLRIFDVPTHFKVDKDENKKRQKK